MHYRAIARIIGILLMMFSISMLPPAAIAWYFADGALVAFIFSFLFTLLIGFIVWYPQRQNRTELKIRDGFLIVTLFWFVLSLFGCIPLIFATHPHMPLTDAMFESVSGLTTTGAEIMVGLDKLPHAILYYRQQLQFLGGMGIIVLAVAILPMLGIGGMQLFKAETPGPMKDSKLTPRITQTAKALWYIYVGLTIACILSYWLTGMSLFDAVGDGFATVSTGGFAMHDNSFSFYQNPMIETIAIVFMFLGAVNFSLHFLVLKHRNLKYYWQDPEFKAFIFLLGFLLSVTVLTLYLHDTYQTGQALWIKGVFNAISMMTTTGFTSSSFHHWPVALITLIGFFTLIGGCAASTSGGLKVIRILLLHKQGMRETMRLIHPHAILPLKFGRHVLPEHVIQAMWAFIAAFLGFALLVILSLMCFGLDLTAASGAMVASFANAGATLGQYMINFTELAPAAKWILIVAMLAGRLEVFTLIVLFTPAFWRK